MEAKLKKPVNVWNPGNDSLSSKNKTKSTNEVFNSKNKKSKMEWASQRQASKTNTENTKQRTSTIEKLEQRVKRLLIEIWKDFHPNDKQFDMHKS